MISVSTFHIPCRRSACNGAEQFRENHYSESRSSLWGVK
jgi:hypothetical protein